VVAVGSSRRVRLVQRSVARSLRCGSDGSRYDAGPRGGVRLIVRITDPATVTGTFPSIGGGCVNRGGALGPQPVTLSEVL